jgi:hypothetical protein
LGARFRVDGTVVVPLFYGSNGEEIGGDPLGVKA